MRNFLDRSSSFTNREELLFRVVLALPYASKTGSRTDIILPSESDEDRSLTSRNDLIFQSHGFLRRGNSQTDEM